MQIQGVLWIHFFYKEEESKTEKERRKKRDKKKRGEVRMNISVSEYKCNGFDTMLRKSIRQGMTCIFIHSMCLGLCTKYYIYRDIKHEALPHTGYHIHLCTRDHKDRMTK